jgi:hypothetical protein
MTRVASSASRAKVTAHTSPSLASLTKQLRYELLVKAAPRRNSQGEDPALARLGKFLAAQSETTRSVLKGIRCSG